MDQEEFESLPVPDQHVLDMVVPEIRKLFDDILNQEVTVLVKRST